MSTFETIGMAPNSELLAFPVQVYTSTTTDANGNWLIDYSECALTHVYSIYATALSPDNTSANVYTASVSSLSTSTASGHVIKPRTVAALGDSPVQSVGAGVTVYVIVYGDQN